MILTSAQKIELALRAGLISKAALHMTDVASDSIAALALRDCERQIQEAKQALNAMRADPQQKTPASRS